MPVLPFDTLDAVPEGLREYATPIEGQEGKVKVNVVAESKLSQFRDANINLLKERDDYRAQLEPLRNVVGEDLDAFTKNLAELQATAQRVKDGDLKESRTIEEALGKRTEELRKSYEERLQAEGKEKAAWRQKHEQLDQQYKLSQVSSYLKDAIMDPNSGVEPKAAADIVAAGLRVFKMDNNGRIIPYEGDAPIYGTDGSTPMNAREWVAKMKEDKPFFFKGTGGGGSGSAPEKTVHGRKPADLKKMSAAELLAVANGDNAPRR